MKLIITLIGISFLLVTCQKEQDKPIYFKVIEDNGSPIEGIGVRFKVTEPSRSFYTSTIIYDTYLVKTNKEGVAVVWLTEKQLKPYFNYRYETIDQQKRDGIVYSKKSSSKYIEEFEDTTTIKLTPIPIPDGIIY